MKAENRRQKAEKSRQKAAGRKQKTDSPVLSHLMSLSCLSLQNSTLKIQN